jgi:hypothetical protein
VPCSLRGTDWILKCYLDQLGLQRTDQSVPSFSGWRNKYFWNNCKNKWRNGFEWDSCELCRTLIRLCIKRFIQFGWLATQKKIILQVFLNVISLRHWIYSNIPFLQTSRLSSEHDFLPFFHHSESLLVVWNCICNIIHRSAVHFCYNLLFWSRRVTPATVLRNRILVALFLLLLFPVMIQNSVVYMKGTGLATVLHYISELLRLFLLRHFIDFIRYLIFCHFLFLYFLFPKNPVEIVS